MDCNSHFDFMLFWWPMHSATLAYELTQQEFIDRCRSCVQRYTTSQSSSLLIIIVIIISGNCISRYYMRSGTKRATSAHKCQRTEHHKQCRIVWTKRMKRLIATTNFGIQMSCPSTAHASVFQHSPDWCVVSVVLRGKWYVLPAFGREMAAELELSARPCTCSSWQ